jgi:hypothetical protein
MRAALGASLVALAAAVSCGAATGSADTLRTGLYGRVTKGPLTPVCAEGRPCEGPARDLKLAFLRNGVVAGRTTTRADGTYRIGLRPGTYRVRTAATRWAPEPDTARVLQNGFRRVNFFVDTGIR